MSGSADIPSTQAGAHSQIEPQPIVVTEQVIDSASTLTSALINAKENSMPVLVGRQGRMPPATKIKKLTCLDLSAMNGVVDYQIADQVISAQVGISVKSLNDLLAQNNQRLAVDVPVNWTLADLLNSGNGGTLKHAFGGPRDLLLGCTMALSDGTLIKGGGKVVKNVSGYDISKLFIGSRGWLAIPVLACFRLHALPQTARTLSWIFDQPAQVTTAARALIQSGLPFSRLEILLTADSQQAVLMAQSEGLMLVVDEVCRVAVDTVSGAVAFTEWQGQAETEQWLKVQNTFMNVGDDQLVQIACPLSLLAELLEMLAGFGALQATPARGTVSLRLENSQAVPTVLNLLAQLSDRNRQKVVAAHCDQSYNYRVSPFPTEPVSAQLTARLKQRFDPAGILSPFVSL